MDNELFELYTDFLISSFRLASALSLSSLTDGLISHDKVSRMLRSEEFSSKDPWEYSKATVRKIESEDAVLIFDDSIEKESAFLFLPQRSMCAYVKLEILRCRKNLNHFALRPRLYYNYLKYSFHYFHKINDLFAQGE